MTAVASAPKVGKVPKVFASAEMFMATASLDSFFHLTHASMCIATRVSFMALSLGRTNTATVSVRLRRREFLPGRGYKTAATLCCLRVRSSLSLWLRSRREAIPRFTSSWKESSRSRVENSVPPTPPARGLRAPDSWTSCWAMARRLPPTSAVTGVAREKLPSFSWTWGWRRALIARVARTRHIVSWRNLALHLSWAASAFLSASSRILTSSLSLLAYLCSNSLRNLSSTTATASSNLLLLALPILILDQQSSPCWPRVPPASVCWLGFWFSESVLLTFMALLSLDR